MSWKFTNWLAAILVSHSVVPPPLEGKPAVVLVHGIHDSGKKMLWLADRMQQAGYETFCPSLDPANGSVPLETSAAQLDRLVSEHFGESRPLHVVGFSMGGLVTRYWLAHYPARKQIVSFATLSAPHHGTWLAFFSGQPGVAEMRPHSPFLEMLAESDAGFDPLHPLSVYTPLDLMIVPFSSSRWAVATNQIRWEMAHPLMVFSPSVARLLLKNMAAAEENFTLSKNQPLQKIRSGR